MKTLVAQLDILETMTPMSFASFRDRLDTSSGFHSHQISRIEFILGYSGRKPLDSSSQAIRDLNRCTAIARAL